ncbi:MAG: hypothetical protein JRL30_29625, partial [Deltaproteobacteria bacterium]|nr:hypothetical protein [Deltaproteobacteria bacterium]
VIYWDFTNAEANYIGDERHAFMPGPTHLNIHEARGTLYVSGLALGDILADQSGALDTHAQLSVSNGVLLDEDITFTPAAATAPANIPVFYRDGASGVWRRDTATDYPCIVFSGGSSRLAWNELTGGSWQQTEVSQGDFVLSHIVATNDETMPYIVVQGQVTYGTLTAARNGAVDEANTLITSGIPFSEFVFLGTVIFQTSTAYGNTPQARIRSTADGGDYVDWRTSSLSPTTGPSAHGDLSGRAAAGQHPASSIETDVTNFNNLLSPTEDEVQKALEVINNNWTSFFPGRASAFHDNSTHGDALNSNSTQSLTPNILRAVRFRVTEKSIDYVNQIIERTAATGTGSFARVGIYADDGANRPGALIFGSSQFAFDTNAIYTTAITETITRGIIWLALVFGVGVGNRTMRAFGVGEGIDIERVSAASTQKTLMVERAFTFAALPDPFGAATLSAAVKPFRCHLEQAS